MDTSLGLMLRMLFSKSIREANDFLPLLEPVSVGQGVCVGGTLSGLAIGFLLSGFADKMAQSMGLENPLSQWTLILQLAISQALNAMREGTWTPEALRLSVFEDHIVLPVFREVVLLKFSFVLASSFFARFCVKFFYSQGDWEALVKEQSVRSILSIIFNFSSALPNFFFFLHDPNLNIPSCVPEVYGCSNWCRTHFVNMDFKVSFMACSGVNIEVICDDQGRVLSGGKKAHKQ